MCVRLNCGVFDVAGCHCRRFPIRDNTIFFDHGIEIPVKMMIGVIGTCPAESCDTQSPGEHRGNLDINELGIGSTIYLPVSVPGARLAIGDCHAVQGDGETAICAMEVSAAVTVRATVLKDAQASMLLSLVGNLRISQVVNPKKGCIMEFPKKYLSAAIDKKKTGTTQKCMQVC